MGRIRNHMKSRLVKKFQKDSSEVPRERQEGIDVFDFPQAFLLEVSGSGDDQESELKKHLPGSQWGYRGKTEMDGGHVSARPRVRSGASTDHTPRVTLQAHGSKAQRLPDLGAYQGLPRLFAQRGGDLVALWSTRWRRSTQMSGRGWRTPA